MADFLTADQHFARALSDVAQGHRALRPPRRMSVSQGAQVALVVKRTGESGKAYSLKGTPYMVRPMDALSDRSKEAVCFVGPAQSGKTLALGEGWLSHIVTNDPGDMLIVQMTEGKAREYSKQRVSPAIKNSPMLQELLSANKRDDNTHDKSFKHGMWLRIAWPTTTNLSSTSYRYVFQTDYDRYDDDLDGEGDAFGLGLARIRTFLSRGKVCVESSPGRPWIDADWKPATPHQAPPVGGVLGIYNRSDRHRWYWKCPDCRDWFEAEPGVKLFGLPPDDQLLDELRTADVGKMARHFASVICPHCGSRIEFKHRQTLLNANGIWVPDGQHLDADDNLVGEATTSSIAGFWLGGVAAAYQTWEGLLNKHLQGLQDYAVTGNEESLKIAVNTDQGMPYMSRHLVEGKGLRRSPADQSNRTLQRYVVPDWTRCVQAAVDVQGGSTARFVVQVHAVGVKGEKALVDRYEIKLSERKTEEGEIAQIDPAGYAEDWDILTKRVALATYKTSDPNREIRVKHVIVDTGGEGDQNGGEGVTHNAYSWYRRLRRLGISARVSLYKGASFKKAPLLKEVRVGKRNNKDVDDIPLLLCNPHLLSDIVSATLKRSTPGEGFMHFPPVKHPTRNPDGWVSQAFFDELTAEQRNEDGSWSKIRKRNETFDLCRMMEAGALKLGLDRVNWARPPDWLLPLAQNEECVTPAERRALKDQFEARMLEVAAEGRSVRPKERVARQRRTANYTLN